MSHERAHSRLLNELYGADISLYPAHLATLNLAAREINDEANYPRIARSDFFDIVPGTPFCELPLGVNKQHLPISLPPLDAIVGKLCSAYAILGLHQATQLTPELTPLVPVR